MKVNEILQYDETMKNLIDNTTMDAKIKFRFLNMRKQFEPVVQNFQQMREEILQKYSEKKEDGSMGIFEPERDAFESDKDYDAALKKFQDTVESFQKDVNSILNDDANIELVKFKAEDIMNAGIPSDALLVIIDLIEE